jgi:hypothetical protein
LLTPKYVIGTFFFIGMIFVPIGLAVLDGRCCLLVCCKTEHECSDVVVRLCLRGFRVCACSTFASGEPANADADFDKDAGLFAQKPLWFVE